MIRGRRIIMSIYLRGYLGRAALTMITLVTILCVGYAGPSLASEQARPVIMGTNGMVACGHYLAAHVGNTILLKGGNAFDAGAAMLLAQSLLEHQSYGFGGEVPIILYSAKDRRVYTIDGSTASPKSVDVAWFQERGITKIPGDGLLCAGVPAVCDAIVLLLDKFGTMSFTEIAAEAIRLADEGFPMYPGMQSAIARMEQRFREQWPGSAALFLPNDRVPRVGEVFCNKDLANTWRKLCEAEQKALAEGKSRSEALKAVRDRFYKGDIAEAIVKFQQENKFMDDLGEEHYGNLTMEDFATYSAKLREPWHINYHGYDVYKCGPWTQGPVFLMHLKLLEQFDLKKLGYGTADYWHVMAETMKLAHADKIEWLGDDEFIDVPKKGLLSTEYAQERAKLVDMMKASSENIPGDPWKYEGRPKPETYPYLPGKYTPPKIGQALDTSKMICSTEIMDTTGTRAVDRWGNVFSATPSGGWFTSSPIIPGLGFCLNTRIQMFYPDRTDHAKSYVPGARPSTSLTPTLVMKDGKPFLAIGMPGGDQQDQVTLQDFIHIVDFGYNIQEAIELPHITTNNMPSLFYPHSRTPGRISLPAGIPPEVIKELEARGHKISQGKNRYNGNSTVVMIDPVTGVLYGAASPSGDQGGHKYAIGW
ncbi:MAG TPA: gamma-glutamyltransferase family protein [Firmicutes bacterium]|nr:gamma-glutamyltransferase family protein [Bacillota bacterium]